MLLTQLVMSCKSEELPTSAEILDLLQTNYTQLPEALISVSMDSSVYAQYAGPTMRYTHGVMGDIIEGTQLIVNEKGQFYELQLDSDFVFEDLRPRLVDIDGDGELEFLCIRTQVEKGAGIVIYHIENDELKEFAQVEEIGKANRWLNYVAVEDLDNDGELELVWIQTPHIGGILKVAKIEKGALTVLDETSLYSNHAFGERNLCLSVLVEKNDKKLIYVPNQERDKIVGFFFKEGKFVKEEEIDMELDFSMSLEEQYSFENIIIKEDNCIKS